MSRRHFLVVDTGEGLELVDLGSSDGTIVNQQAKRRAMLKTGDSIAAGDTVLTVSVLSGE
jgi:pSer/pThr/pTyr-binding forkhead associated (FHA) protein